MHKSVPPNRSLGAMPAGNFPQMPGWRESTPAVGATIDRGKVRVAAAKSSKSVYRSGPDPSFDRQQKRNPAGKTAGKGK